MRFHDAQTGRVLKQHYEKLLLVYDVYETGIYGEHNENNNTDAKKPVTGRRPFDLRSIFHCSFRIQRTDEKRKQTEGHIE